MTPSIGIVIDCQPVSTLFLVNRYKNYRNQSPFAKVIAKSLLPPYVYLCTLVDTGTMGLCACVILHITGQVVHNYLTSPT